MEINPRQDSVKAPPAMFTGDAWFDTIATPRPTPSRLRVNAVHFAPCARTAWHTHAYGQTLHVTEGVGLIQSRGGEVLEIRPGDTTYTPPGEEHWHGATPGRFMTHLAMWDAALEGEDPEVAWGALVTDEEYRRPPSARP